MRWTRKEFGGVRGRASGSNQEFYGIWVYRAGFERVHKINTTAGTAWTKAVPSCPGGID